MAPVAEGGGLNTVVQGRFGQSRFVMRSASSTRLLDPKLHGEIKESSIEI